jgi:VWFA-related protein
MLLLAAAFVAGPARASVDLRVEGRPVTGPIEAFVTVTDSSGVPVGGLTAGAFTVTLDGVPIPIQPSDLTLPPAQDPNQKVSVVFAMDYSLSVTVLALTAMQDAVIDFIGAMNVGDYAAIIKFNSTNPAKASVVWPFTQIDQGAGNLALTNAVMDDYPGSGTNLLDAVSLAANQFAAPPSPLPAGPKAIIVVSDGLENRSTVTESEAIAAANDNSIPVFTIGVADFDAQGGTALLTSLAVQTGGDFFPAPSDADIAAAYASVSALLNNEYRLTMQSSISDCAQHTLQVTVAGHPPPASSSFTRRDCDTTPDPFSFADRTDVARSKQIKSNPVTISGLEAPAAISITAGQYSIGCGDIFTNDDGTISNGQTVCVRHTTSSELATVKVTTLTVGGVSSTFTSTTSAKDGGGGATGALELLVGLAVLFARRRRRA